MRIGRPYAQWAAHRAGMGKYVCPWALYLHIYPYSFWAGPGSPKDVTINIRAGWAAHFLMGFAYGPVCSGNENIKKLTSFKNVSFTLAMHHARWQLASLFVLKDGVVEGKRFEDDIRPAKKLKQVDIRRDVRDHFSLELMTAEVYRTVKIGSVKYQAGHVLDLSQLQDWDPKFAEIEMFLKSEEGWEVIVRHIRSTSFISQLGRFEGTAGGLEILHFSDLPFKFIQPSYRHNDTYYVSRKYSSALEVF